MVTKDIVLVVADAAGVSQHTLIDVSHIDQTPDADLVTDYCSN